MRPSSATFSSLAAQDDHDELDEQFSASVAGRDLEADQQDDEDEEAAEPQHRVRTRYVPPEPLLDSPARAAASAVEYGEPPHATGGAWPRTGIEREFSERARLEQDLDRRSEFWRDEVARTVQSYRTRRSRKRLAGEFSMKLDFEGRREPLVSRAASAAMPVEEVEEDVLEMEEPQPEAEELPPPMPACAHQQAPEFLEDSDTFPENSDSFSFAEPAPAETNLIEFPRPASLEQPSFDGLAEPILNKPRILDVPESVAYASPEPLADVALEAEEPEDALPLMAEFDMPLQAAPWPQRISAALLDALVILLATATFAMIVAYFTAGIPRTRATLVLAALVPCVFWGVYQYLFLVYAGGTPGMQMADLQVATFEGEWTPRSLRRWRAVLMMLSGASLGLGFLWALFDEDTLCWHDRMTRTYLKQGDK